MTHIAAQSEQARAFMGYSRRTIDGVLNAWANSKLRQSEIASVFGISHNYVWNIIYQAKLDGDQRAFARKDATNARNYAILKCWDGGRLSVKNVSEIMGISDKIVSSVLKRAREAGDPLAIRTHKNEPAPKRMPSTPLYQKIASLRNKGLTTRQIGDLLNRSPRAVRDFERYTRNKTRKGKQDAD